MAPLDLSLSQSNAGFRLRLRTQSGKCGCRVGVAQTGTSLPRVSPSASIHLPDSVSGAAQQPLHRLRGLGVGAEGVQSNLCWLFPYCLSSEGCFAPANSKDLLYEDSLDLKPWENIPGVTASESPLCSILCPWFQGAEALGL